jgi:hypothetical protein
MMKHVQFSPNLYTTALTVLRNLPRDLQAWGHANWPARLQVELDNGNWKIINKHCISWNMLKIYLNLILNILSSFSIIHKVKGIKQTTDDICPEVRMSSIKCHFTRYHSSITAEPQLLKSVWKNKTIIGYR